MLTKKISYRMGSRLPEINESDLEISANGLNLPKKWFE